MLKQILFKYYFTNPYILLFLLIATNGLTSSGLVAMGLELNSDVPYLVSILNLKAVLNTNDSISYQLLKFNPRTQSYLLLILKFQWPKVNHRRPCNFHKIRIPNSVIDSSFFQNSFQFFTSFQLVTKYRIKVRMAIYSEQWEKGKILFLSKTNQLHYFHPELSFLNSFWYWNWVIFSTNQKRCWVLFLGSSHIYLKLCAKATMIQSFTKIIYLDDSSSKNTSHRQNLMILSFIFVDGKIKETRSDFSLTSAFSYKCG